MRLASNFNAQIKNSLSMLGLGTAFFTGYSIYDGNENFYYNFLMPMIHTLFSPENSHKIAVVMGKYNLFPKFANNTYPHLGVNVFGLKFNHPVGVAAGFDKNGECILGLLRAGFSHVEIGSITPEPQPGNEKPRVFRLSHDKAVINRYGFNSDGHDVVYNRLRDTNWKDLGGIVGVNLGVNKHNLQNATDDYVAGVLKFGDLCDYLVINVSSPNTQGLRGLQKKSTLVDMLEQVVRARNTLSKKTPLLLKISPDESDEQVRDIVDAALQSGIDGLIVSNTTVTRENLSSPINLTSQAGGLSGKPLVEKSTSLIARIATLTRGRLPIIGVGGVDSGRDTWIKLMAGASLVQLYTAMVYYGPPIAKKVVSELSDEMHASPYQSMQELLVKHGQKE